MLPWVPEVYSLHKTSEQYEVSEVLVSSDLWFQPSNRLKPHFHVDTTRLWLKVILQCLDKRF